MDNDILQISTYQVKLFNTYLMSDQPFLYESADFEPRCFKTYPAMDPQNNKINELLALKQNELIRIFTRELQLINGEVASKTKFALLN